MMFKIISIAFVLCLLFAASPVWGLDLNPGKYEITVQVELAGMPGGMPAQTTTQCLTKKDPVPSASAESQGCKVTDMKTMGNTVTYSMICHQQGMQTESTGKMTFHGDTFDGTTRMNLGAGGGMQMTTKVTGKRVGKCE